MTPVADHLIIAPDILKNKAESGLVLSFSTPQVHTAKVLKVSQDIKDAPVKEGDSIAYLYPQEKNIDGNCILNLNHVQAVL